jgi:aryl-alcohol dehydrogenase-like predicted oxidoreductase
MEAAKRRGIAVIVREPLVNGLATGKYTSGSAFGEGDIRNNFPLQYREDVLHEVNDIRRRFAHRPASLAQVALKYVLSFDAASVVIPGTKTRQQAEENMKASDLPDLTEEELAVFGS